MKVLASGYAARLLGICMFMDADLHGNITVFAVESPFIHILVVPGA